MSMIFKYNHSFSISFFRLFTLSTFYLGLHCTYDKTRNAFAILFQFFNGVKILKG